MEIEGLDQQQEERLLQDNQYNPQEFANKYFRQGGARRRYTHTHAHTHTHTHTHQHTHTHAHMSCTTHTQCEILFFSFFDSHLLFLTLLFSALHTLTHR